MIDTQSADALQRMIEAQKSLSSPHEQYVQGQVRMWEAIRESKREIIQNLVGWPKDRDYIVDPLPAKISEAFADLLFGEDPVILSAQAAADLHKEDAAPADSDVQSGEEDEAPEASRYGPDETGPPDVDQDGKEDVDDQSKLEAIIEANDLPSELRESEMLCSSEGEVWWRIYVDPGQSDYPIIEWHSRSHVRPLFRGRKLVAAAFVSEIHRETSDRTAGRGQGGGEAPGGPEVTVYRYVEIHAVGYVRNLLYKGTSAELGIEVSLDTRPETADLMEEWNHGLAGMLCGRIPNRLGRDRRYGISDYHPIKDLVYSLNEATTIGHENMRLTAKKRAVVPLSALKDDGKWDASEDLLVVDDTDLDAELGSEKGKAQFAVLEYSFDAQALIAYKTDIAEIMLTRVGISQQFVNTNSRNLGAAESGTALRVRLIPTTLAAKGKARFWDDSLPKILMLAQLVDALPENQGGFGRGWKLPGEPPSVERSQPLPQDETEEVTRHATAVGAEIESRRQAITDLHQDWTDEQVDEELKQIDKELAEFGKPKDSGPPNNNQQETLA